MVVRGRLEGEMDENALRLTSSMDFDEHIFGYDIVVDYAHVIMLERQGIIGRESAKKIISALRRIEQKGFENLEKNFDDVHESIEAELIKIAGDDGKKMHTARSRNDEIATCLRLFSRDRILDILAEILNLRSVLLKKASEYKNAVMPGFTHLQYAQPTKLSHHLLAWHDMIWRDYERFSDAFKRVNLSPLGSSAFSGTSFPVDREFVADLLGFGGIVENSMDAVSSRDFLIECVFACTSLMLSFSRMCEEIILWTSEFGFVELPDEYASSSSIMPQKKNPDVAEIIRAKTGKLVGMHTSVMTIYKAMPFAYNRDFQEMNRILFDAMNETLLSCRVMCGMIDKLKFNESVMREKAGKGFSTATDLANLLVEKGVPFRTAHKIVGEIAKSEDCMPSAEKVTEMCMKYGVEVSITEEELRNALIVELSLERKKSPGGTSDENIRKMIESRSKNIRKDENRLAEMKRNINQSLNRLYEMVNGYEG